MFQSTSVQNISREEAVEEGHVPAVGEESGHSEEQGEKLGSGLEGAVHYKVLRVHFKVLRVHHPPGVPRCTPQQEGSEMSELRIWNFRVAEVRSRGSRLRLSRSFGSGGWEEPASSTRRAI